MCKFLVSFLSISLFCVSLAVPFYGVQATSIDDHGKVTMVAGGGVGGHPCRTCR